MAVAIVGTPEVFIGLVLYTAPEEGLTRITGHAAKVETLGTIPTHPAHLAGRGLLLLNGTHPGDHSRAQLVVVRVRLVQ